MNGTRTSSMLLRHLFGPWVGWTSIGGHGNGGYTLSRGADKRSPFKQGELRRELSTPVGFLLRIALDGYSCSSLWTSDSRQQHPLPFLSRSVSLVYRNP